MKCETCGEVFKNNHGLRIHQGRKHPDNYRVTITSAHAPIVRELVASLEARAQELGVPFESVAHALMDHSRAPLTAVPESA